jgi:hypothetical protein
MELCTTSPDAAALLIMDYRDLIIESMQQKAAIRRTERVSPI